MRTIFPFIKQLTIFSTVLLFSCNGSQPVSETYTFPIDTMQIDIDTYASNEKFIIKANSIEAIRFIPLETNDNSLIGEVSKVQTGNDRIFVLDNSISKTLFIFDPDGNFLFRIGTKGNGPGEFFRGPHDFSIDSDRKQIYVFEAEARKVVVFDWNGTFIREKKFDKFPYAFALLGPGKHALAYRTKSDKYELAITGNEGNERFRFGKIPTDLAFTSTFPITVNEGNVWFSPNLSNLICKIGNDSISRGIFFDFGKYNLPQTLKTELQKDFDPSKLNSNVYVTGISNVLESDQLLFFRYPRGGLFLYYIGNKQSKAYRTGTSLFESIIPSDIKEIKGDILLSALNVQWYEQYNQIKKDNTSEARSFMAKIPGELRNLLDTIPESANPTLCIFRIKSFD